MPKTTQPKKTQKYSEEFKSKAVQLSLFSDVKVKDVAKKLDIHPFMLSRWRKEFREGKIMPDKRKKVVTVKKEERKKLFEEETSTITFRLKNNEPRAMRE